MNSQYHKRVTDPGFGKQILASSIAMSADNALNNSPVHSYVMNESNSMQWTPGFQFVFIKYLRSNPVGFHKRRLYSFMT